MCVDGLLNCRKELKSSNGVAVALVYVILLIDNMLLTAVVPVLPEYLKEIYDPPPNKNVSEKTNESFLSETMSSSVMEEVKNTTNTSCASLSDIHFLIRENLYIGLLFASKPLIQSFANLFVGPIVDRIGFNLPMVFGNVIMCLSAFLFAFGKSYSVLMIARAVQGIGSSSSSVAGIAMLADRYKQEPDEKRGKAIGIAFGGLAMGVLIGPTFASGVFQLAGKEAVFLVLSVIAIIIAGFVVFINGITVQKSDEERNPVTLLGLFKDPYIVVAALTLMLGSLGAGILEAALPLWMLETMCSQKWELGVAFLPISLSYLIMINIVALFCQKIPRWLLACGGLVFIAAGCFATPFAKNIVGLIPSGVAHGIGIGFIDSSIFPMVAVLVDRRHKSIYGSVYAIADLSFCFAFVIGPLFAGFAVQALGFRWLMWVFTIVAFVFSPFVLFLRKPTTMTEESLPILYHSEEKKEDHVGTPNGMMINRSSPEE